MRGHRAGSEEERRGSSSCHLTNIHQFKHSDDSPSRQVLRDSIENVWEVFESGDDIIGVVSASDDGL